MGKTLENNVIDIDLSALRKKRIRINGDDTKIIEINVSDMGVITRLQEAYDRLISLANKYNLQEEESKTEGDTNNISDEEIVETLRRLDTEMRELIDFIFQANVSEICADDGTMADPINGQLDLNISLRNF